jgi:hypothetical protein
MEYFLSYRSRLFNSLVYIFSSILGFAVIVASVIILRLAVGPISLDFAKPYVLNNLQSSFKNVSIDAESATLKWDKKQFRAEIVLKKVSVKNPNELTLNIPQADIAYRPLDLFFGNLIPADIDIHDLKLVIQAGSTNDDVVVGEYLKLFSSHWEQLQPLHKIVLSNADIDFRHPTKSTHLKNVNAQITVRDNQIDFDGALDVKDSNADMHGTLKFDSENKFKINLAGAVHDIKWEDVDTFWHNDIAPLPRDWVLTNLSDGFVPKATINMAFNVTLKDNNATIDVEQVEGDIQFKDMTVQYWEGLPVVKNVAGTATYDKYAFNIKTSQGTINNMEVTDSTIVVSHLDEEDQDMDVVLSVNGPLQKALEVINAPKLKWAEKYNFHPNNVAGDATITLNVKCPIHTSLQPEEVTYDCSAKLSSAHVKNAATVSSRPIHLKEATLDLAVNNKGLTLKGDGKLNKHKATVLWEEDFTQSPKWRRKYAVQLHTQGHKLAKYELPFICDGTLEPKLTLTFNDDGSSIVHLDADLTQTAIDIPVLGRIKESGEKADFNLIATFKNDKVTSIENCSIVGKDLSAIAQLDFANNGQLSKLTLRDAQVGQNFFSLDVQKKPKSASYDVQIYGPQINLSPLLSQSQNDHDTGRDPIFVSFNFDQAVCKENPPLKRLKGNFVLQEGKIQYANIQAKTNGDNNEDEKVECQIIHRNGAREFTMTATNAGNLFDSFGVLKTLKNGHTTIQLTENSQDNAWVGTMKVLNFHMENAPFLTQLMSIASPFQIFEIAAGTPVRFEHYLCDLKITPDKVILQDGKATGTSLGMTLSGILNRQTETVKFYGTVLPANYFNEILVHIPLIGDLIGGKQGGLLGINYDLTGSFEKQKISVNPLSALTPGFIRNIFSPIDAEVL